MLICINLWECCECGDVAKNPLRGATEEEDLGMDAAHMCMSMPLAIANH